MRNPYRSVVVGDGWHAGRCSAAARIVPRSTIGIHAARAAGTVFPHRRFFAPGTDRDAKSSIPAPCHSSLGDGRPSAPCCPGNPRHAHRTAQSDYAVVMAGEIDMLLDVRNPSQGRRALVQQGTNSPAMTTA